MAEPDDEIKEEETEDISMHGIEKKCIHGFDQGT
jgi:hypothetical protein